jgi:hypothetical protein
MSNPRRAGHGHVVWHDLMTTNPKASLAFFTELLGWRTTEADMGPMGTYTMFSAGDRNVGGMMPLDPAHGAPSHFMAYFHVDDLDAALARAQELGGKVLVPPTPIPNVGTFAVLADPLGGITSPMHMTMEPPDESGGERQGIFCWEELGSTDPEASVKFYTHVYGYSITKLGPEMGNYQMFMAGSRGIGGVMKPPAEAPQMTNWVSYIVVDDTDATAGRAEKLGGKVLYPPTDIPTVGRFAILQDPAGAVFAVLKPLPQPAAQAS